MRSSESRHSLGRRIGHVERQIQRPAAEMNIVMDKPVAVVVGADDLVTMVTRKMAAGRWRESGNILGVLPV